MRFCPFFKYIFLLSFIILLVLIALGMLVVANSKRNNSYFGPPHVDKYFLNTSPFNACLLKRERDFCKLVESGQTTFRKQKLAMHAFRLNTLMFPL